MRSLAGIGFGRDRDWSSGRSQRGGKAAVRTKSQFLTLFIGVLAGYLASRLAGNNFGVIGFFFYLAIGAFGASIGGSLFSLIGINVNEYSPLLLRLLSSAIGAIIFVLGLSLFI